ncbi:GLPGLI family protein [Chryseobacterium fluminis]|uniref:GLPGLI family protein n=1 Tax=Chryseobacterium fluminis TaxID=2983606 RepID=UPI00225A1AF9|nr:GLPGLI family protein [Chryseobacterium sp. MMS21-Ot14]UZT98664.1 GLPGLI family protein [Chryseobacterium sp. MMS21-Ot14]
MKNILFLLIFLSMFADAQVNRFYYDYRFIPDSNHKEDVKKEMMYLDIDEKGSIYYSRDRFIADSTSMADIRRQIKSGSGSLNVTRNERAGQVSYKVTKEYPEFKTFLFTRVSMDLYKVKEDQKPEWKILAEKQKIGEYDTQKATTTYGGREWIAWFSTAIPFQDGPYKFYGLPGLIVKLEDTTGSHIMTLVGNRKIDSPVVETESGITGNLKIVGIGGKELEISKDQYRKVWKAYVNDPSKNMREMMMRNSGGDNTKMSFKVKTSDGKEISDPSQMFREMEKKTKESLAKNNNPIEPDLVK